MKLATELEHLNEHWFTSLARARVAIETWRGEYNEERPKKVLGGLTPAAYAQQLAKKTVTVTSDSNSNRTSDRDLDQVRATERL